MNILFFITNFKIQTWYEYAELCDFYDRPTTWDVIAFKESLFTTIEFRLLLTWSLLCLAVLSWSSPPCIIGVSRLTSLSWSCQEQRNFRAMHRGKDGGLTQYRIAYWTLLLDHCSVCEISSNNVRQINWILLCLTTSRMSFICTRTNAAVRPRNIQFFVLLSRSMSVDSYIYSPFYLSDGCLLWPFLVFCSHTDQRARQDHNIEMESLAYIWSVGAVLPNNNLLLHICRITDALVSCNKTIID